MIFDITCSDQHSRCGCRRGGQGEEHLTMSGWNLNLCLFVLLRSGNHSCSAGSVKYNDTDPCWGSVSRKNAYRVFLVSESSSTTACMFPSLLPVELFVLRTGAPLWTIPLKSVTNNQCLDGVHSLHRMRRPQSLNSTPIKEIKTSGRTTEEDTNTQLLQLVCTQPLQRFSLPV